MVYRNTFTDEEFKEKMLQAESDTLVDFLGRDFLIYNDNGDIIGEINIEPAIEEVFQQMPQEELSEFWRKINR